MAGLEQRGQSLELDALVDWQPVEGPQNWTNLAVFSAPQDDGYNIVLNPLQSVHLVAWNYVQEDFAVAQVRSY